MSAAMRPTAAGLAALLGDYAFRYSSEDELQAGLTAALRDLGHQPQREVILSARDRVDILVDGIAIEVKIAGTVDALQRQLTRYASHPQVRQLLVVTTVSRHRTVPQLVATLPCHVLHIGGVR